MTRAADPLYIAVIGASRADSEQLEQARAVGAAVAEADATLVCGGLGGVMEAACQGARQVGGVTVGILPGDDRSQVNRHVQVAIPTGLGELRNGLIVRAADALIAIGCGWGTLSEIALALRTGRPVVALGSWQLKEHDGRTVEYASDPLEAARRALALARSGRVGARHQP